MAPSELIKARRQIPFHPFRVILLDGRSYDILQPEGMLVGMTFVVVSIYGRQKEFAKNFTTLDLNQVVRVEPIET